MKTTGSLVIIGQSPEDKPYWDKAIADGWIPGRTLFLIEEAVESHHHQYLVSDAAQMILWPKSQTALKRKATRCISRMVFHCISKNRPV